MTWLSSGPRISSFGSSRRNNLTPCRFAQLFGTTTAILVALPMCIFFKMYPLNNFSLRSGVLLAQGPSIGFLATTRVNRQLEPISVPIRDNSSNREGCRCVPLGFIAAETVRLEHMFRIRVQANPEE